MDASKAKKEASGVKISFLHVNRIHCYYPNRYPGAPYPSFFVPVNSFFIGKVLETWFQCTNPQTLSKKIGGSSGDETIGIVTQQPSSFFATRCCG
jgi:hypothetical protein